MSDQQRVTTLRVDADQHAELETVARVEGVTMSQVIRDAIAAALDERRNDPEFQERLRRHLEENRVVLERLADGDRSQP